MRSQPSPTRTTPSPPAVQTPIPEPEPSRAVPPLFSGRPTSSSPPETSQSSTDSGEAGPFGGFDGPSEPPSDAPAPGSAPSGKAFSRKAIRDAIWVGLESGSNTAHEVLCRDELDRAYERWLAEQDELDALADPVAGLVSRRMSAAGVAASPDTADAIAAGVALLRYLVRQLRLWRAVRVERARLAGGYVPADDEQPAPERA